MFGSRSSGACFTRRFDSSTYDGPTSTTFGPDQSSPFRGCRGVEGGFEREKCAFARNAERIRARGWERARFFTKGLSRICARFFPFQLTTTTTTAAGGFSSDPSAKKTTTSTTLRAVSQVRDEKRLTLLFLSSSSSPNRQPIRSVQNHQRHGRTMIRHGKKALRLNLPADPQRKALPVET